MLLPSWTEAPAEWRWANFTPGELACRCGGRFCGGEYWHDPVFLDALQTLREAMGAPVSVNSAHRYGLWNAHVGGAPASQHKMIAADIRIACHDPGRLLAAGREAGFGSFGLYRTFIHMDLRAGRRWFGAGARSAWTGILETSGEARRWWT